MEIKLYFMAEQRSSVFKCRALRDSSQAGLCLGGDPGIIAMAHNEWNLFGRAQHGRFIELAGRHGRTTLLLWESHKMDCGSSCGFAWH